MPNHTHTYLFVDTVDLHAMDPISFDMPINMILVSTNDSVSSASLNESTGESKTVNHLRNESVFCEPSIHLTSSPRAGGDDVEIDDWGASFRTQVGTALESIPW